MKVTIITPTHDTRYLGELAGTIMAQTYKNWEWVILLNGGASFDFAQEPSFDAGDRIKVIECPFVTSSVGMLKHLACMHASGDVIAEVDHDDLLTPDCLEKIAVAFRDPETGFVYSRNAKLCKNFNPYLEWEHSLFTWKGKRYIQMHNQPLYPGRLGHIWYAPDHIRAWRKEVYDKIGGHNDTLKVCDDLDLMHRMYLETKFTEIPEVLYMYRINEDNTWKKNRELINKLDAKLYGLNIESLCRRFAKINGFEIIDLGQGNSEEAQGTGHRAQGKTGFEGVRDNSVGLIKAVDVLQYVEDPQGWLKEAHRVLAPGGMLISETPSSDGRGGFMYPGTKSFWNENSFWFYTRSNYAKRVKQKVLFRECELSTYYKSDEDKEHRVAYVRAHLEKI